MVGKETSFSAPVSRRNVSSASTASISVSVPARRLAVEPGEEARQRHARRADARCACRRSRSRSSPPSAARPDRCRAPACRRRPRSCGSARRRRSRCRGRSPRRVCASSRRAAAPAASGSATSAIALEMVARAVGELAAVDEDGRPAVLRHQRVGQRQRRMRDVGAADVEGPGHARADPTAPARRRRSLAISSRMRVELRRSRLSPANFRPWTATGPSGGAGRSCQTASIGLPSTATSSAPALAQAAASRSAAAEVCSQGSNPRRSPAFECRASQCSGGGSTSELDGPGRACRPAWPACRV